MRTSVIHAAFGSTPWQQYSRPLDGLRLRPATPGDVIELATLKRRVESAAYAHLGTADALAVRLHRRCTAWYLLSRLGDGDLILVAELRDQLLGMAAATVEHGGSPALRLHSAYVEHGGYGAGRALTSARLEAGSRLGIDTVVAGSFEGAAPAALRLRGLGLVPVGPAVACPTFPGVRRLRWEGSLEVARRASFG